MGHQENRISDSPFSNWLGNNEPPDDDPENVRAAAASARAREEAGAAIARQLNGPLTALLLYVGEIKQHSHQLSQAAANRVYLQQVVESALQQTERVCAMIKEISQFNGEPVVEARKSGWEKHTTRGGSSKLIFASGAGQKPLTKREREVLNLVSAGYSNKQGALRMSISPRTFESH